MERVLILGGAGQDGLILATSQLAKGNLVLSTTHSESYRQRIASTGNGVSSQLVDIRDKNEVKKVIETFSPSRVYNLAGVSSVKRSWECPGESLEVNAVGVANILEAIRSRGPKSSRYFQASSSEMYSLSEEGITEQSTFSPSSPYGVSKVAAHQLVGAYRDVDGIFACSGILFNHESPLRPLNFVTRHISRQVAEIELGMRQELLIGNLEIRRDWGWAPDYVAAMELIMDAGEPSDFVVSTDEVRSVRELVELAFAAVGIKEWEKYTRLDPDFERPNDPPESFGDSRKIRRELGWRTTVSLENIMRRMVDADLARIRFGENHFNPKLLNTLATPSF